MPRIVRDLLIGMAVFFTPVAVVAALNWESARKYVYVTPEEATGYVLAFDAKG